MHGTIICHNTAPGSMAGTAKGRPNGTSESFSERKAYPLGINIFLRETTLIKGELHISSIARRSESLFNDCDAFHGCHATDCKIGDGPDGRRSGFAHELANGRCCQSND